jgi:CRISPR-associated endonuclease Cas1
MRWSGLKRRPVPPAWLTYEQRSSILTGKKPENYKASNPINAMLNYAYAILEAEVRIRLISEGYDPRIGILHVGRKREKQDSFVFDMMEQLRPIADSAVLEFARSKVFAAEDFVLRSDGVCRLNPQLARFVALQTQAAVSRAPLEVSF